MGEQWAFHGTVEESVDKIVKFGFDHRLARNSGFYGQGTYFASQSCKAHQYTCEECGPAKECFCRHTRWLILARVAFGSPYYTRRTCKGCKRPPERDDGPKLHDCVIANPGPMEGHFRRHQDHQEIVIFESAQAYPAY